MTGDDGRERSVERRRLLAAMGVLGTAGFAGCAGGDDATPSEADADPTAQSETASTATGTRTPDAGRLERVTPGRGGLSGDPPGDAVVLWNGADATLDGWEGVDGGDPGWTETDDYFETVRGAGDVRPTESIGDCHLHVEWSVPEGVDGEGQRRGNSGLFVMGEYEFQILDSYDNPTYPTGYAAAYYAGDAPLVLPIRPQGEWQTYDLLWRGPRFDGGELARPARATLLFNGVAVLAHYDVPGPNSTEILDYGDEHPRVDGSYATELPFSLQDHGGENDTVRFRNVWYRPLPADPVESADAADRPTAASAAGGDERPEQVPPGGVGTTGDPPGDAETLIRGGDLSAWRGVDGGDPAWNDRGDYVEVEPGAGDIATRDAVGDCQFHVEWRVPEGVEGTGTDRGASGLLAMGRYEFGILDSHDNPVAADRWAGAYVGGAPPHHDAVREPGEWQQFDAVWQGPRFEGGELVRPARATLFLNGVAVHTRLRIDGPNADGTVGEYEAHDRARPLVLREEGSRVQFRNAWYRPLGR